MKIIRTIHFLMLCQPLSQQLQINGFMQITFFEIGYKARVFNFLIFLHNPMYRRTFDFYTVATNVQFNLTQTSSRIVLNPQKGRPSSLHSFQNKYADYNNLFSRGLKRVPLSKTSQLNYFSSSCQCVCITDLIDSLKSFNELPFVAV